MPIFAVAMVKLNEKSAVPMRLSVAAVVAVLHVVILAALIRAFAPEMAASVIRPTLQAFDLTMPAPKQPEKQRPVQIKATAPSENGMAAPAGKKADPKQIAAPKAPVVLSQMVAPPVASSGNANSAGATAAGEGPGAGGIGNGLGSGDSGTGTGGGGAAAKPVKIAGDIVSARDYPQATRDLRLGSAVTVMLTITKEGRVGGCRVARPSRDPEADRITCRLATERFRFRPATDSAGLPVEAVYGWQQRWFTPGRK